MVQESQPGTGDGLYVRRQNSVAAPVVVVFSGYLVLPNGGHVYAIRKGLIRESPF